MSGREELVAHLARLAGLEPDAAERADLARRLGALQELVRALPAADDSGDDGGLAPPLALREDDPAPPLPAELALRPAAARDGDWLDCPPVVEDDR